MKIKEIKLLEPTKENNFAKLDKDISNKSGVYLLFDKKFLLIYVGAGKNIRHRILQHTTDSDNGRYELDGSRIGMTSFLPKGIVKYYSEIEIEDPDQRKTTELLLIHLLKPYFNFQDLNKKIRDYLNANP